MTDPDPCYKVKQSEPLLLPERADLLSEEEYTKYKVTGAFDNSQEIYIGPRYDYYKIDSTLEEH